MSKTWEQILGGYATDTLSQEEKHQLLEAALHDQLLFDALADEEALKSLLADPKARQRILASLQASGSPRGAARPHRPWFRRPSSLAWAGSIAAMGLALIFGWQMETDWGPVVQQEQHVERAVSEEKDTGVFRSQASGIAKVNEEAPDSQKPSQGVSERVASLAAPVPLSTPSTMPKASEGMSRKRQHLAQGRVGKNSRKEVREESRLIAQASVTSSPEPAVVRNILEDNQFLASPVESSKLAGEGLQQLPGIASVVEQVHKQDGRSSRIAREWFYANKGRRADAEEEKRVIREDASNLLETQKPDIDFALEAARGIRYRFVRRSLNGKDEVIDRTTFSGKWSELTLKIESNVSGYLYVLTSFGTGKWQWVRPGFLNVPRSPDGGINVMPYQPVSFALSQVTNTLGKPVVSSITVLLSSAPLLNLGRSLGGRDDMSEVQIAREEGEVFVVETIAEPGDPFKMEIVLK